MAADSAPLTCPSASPMRPADGSPWEHQSRLPVLPPTRLDGREGLGETFENHLNVRRHRERRE